MKIRGKCHCGNIGFELEFPGEAKEARLARRKQRWIPDVRVTAVR